DRLRRAGLLAGGDDLSVAHAAVLLFGADLGDRDALDAVRALLHHAAPPHRDLGVGEHPHRGRAELRAVMEVVEPPDLVGAGVGAVAGADAAVVDHVVQPLGAVYGRADGADELAGGLLAVHAGDRLVVGLRVPLAPLEIAVHADPVHRVAARDLVLADGRDVVLR